LTIPFLNAVQARDMVALKASLAPDVKFHTTFRRKPFTTREVVGTVLQVPAFLFAFKDTFAYTHVLSGPDEWHALVFRGEFEGEPFEGVDLLQLDDDRLVRELRISMRPLPVVEKIGAAARKMVAELTHGSP
jgi:hypothetical protein